jgi:DNA processing protein|tara:strand:+ start:3161 stop:3772 length:612 start_codon:yes stop_codon:yes gene_type:complete
VIGTRECTVEGSEIGFETAKYFAKNGYNIVSGLANGIDTSAHQAALLAKGKTTAVLVDIQNIIPKENLTLSEDIYEGGGLLFAENKPGTAIVPGLFVERDRLQSAMTKAVFPIESNIQGGTMHTVDFAQEQGKKIFCPDLTNKKGYPINNPMSKGITRLINNNRAEPYSMDKLDVVLNILNEITVEDFQNNQTSWGGKQMPIE